MTFLLAFFLCSLQLIQCQEGLVEMDVVTKVLNDLAEFNLTCGGDSCESSQSCFDSTSTNNCHCSILCAQLGTCCADSAFARIPRPKQKPVCRKTFDQKSYFMKDECFATDSTWTSLCNEEWDGDDDVRKIVPVTSLSTSITYKNYYCFRCHEATDDFLYWTAKLESREYNNSVEESEKLRRNNKGIALTYDKELQTWMASNGEDIPYFPVRLSLSIPSNAEKLVHDCVVDVISNCSADWTDEDVRNKCHAYMGLKEVMHDGTYLTYKNVHCALCNFVSLNDIQCKLKYGYGGYGFTKFSFTYLMDINRSDGELVGKIQKCSESHIWDPHAKRCRKLVCALPGFKVEGGKCVEE